MTFTFTHVPRRGFKVFAALIGASGTGKTLSALRLARGIAQVAGGEVVALDSEGGRMIAAMQNRELVDGKSWFRYGEFGPPYTPARYVEAIETAAAQGAAVVLIDSMSHEHDGEGGSLDRHLAYTGGSEKKNFIGWARIRQEQRVLHRLLEKPPVHVIATFKAKEKLSVRRGEEPVSLGWMPIGDREYVYAMTIRLILRPDAPGAPSDPRSMISVQGRVSEADIQKCPAGLEPLMDGDPLCERDGELIARWAALGNTSDLEAATAARWSTVVRRYAADHNLAPRDAAARIISEAGLPGPPSTWPPDGASDLWDRAERLLGKET